jgi:sarcosine oxidase
MTASSQRFDTIVVGVGGMGSATVYELAKRGRRVLGLEQFDIPHSRGSSHGYTRIIRLPYYEHPAYVPLLLRAYDLWDEIQARAGEQLLYITGSLDAGPEDDWVFKGALQSATLYNLPHEVLTSADITRRFPGYRLPPETMGLLQPRGGFLTPERCIVAYANVAMSLGAEIHGRETVQSFAATSQGGVRVTTDRRVYESDSLVFTGGAWMSRLLPILDGLAVPERQVLAWLQPSRPELFAPDRFPVFNCAVPEGRFYGFPVFAVPGFKFGKYHHRSETGDPDHLLTEPTPEDEAVLRDFAAKHFPDGAGPTMALHPCMFTNSPDEHFILDRHPDHPQVTLAAGFSGHGYKFCSVIGEIMADLVERGASRLDISLFRLGRFADQAAPTPH